MLFRRYDMLILRADASEPRQVRFRAVWLLSLVVLVAVLAAGNLFSLQYYLEDAGLDRDIRAQEAQAKEQQLTFLSLVNRARYLENDLASVSDLDGKLQVILDLAPEDTVRPASMGGSYGGEISPRYPSAQRMESLVRSMHSFLKHLETAARMEEIRQQEIIGAIRSKQERWAATPSITPARGRVTSDFGWRKSPFTGRREFHHGLDISASRGTPVLAPARGRVTYAGREGSYGRIIHMKHGFELSTRYAHLYKIAVRSGQTVERGDIIGYVGNTGRSTGPHLHYEVRKKNRPVNPNLYIAD
jgi:murein DD-endopeptidase MepM/ murein hydrolase activator NlpD